MWMINFDRDSASGRQFSEVAGFRAERKGDELNRAYLVGRHLALVKAGAGAASVQDHPQMTFQAHEAGKLHIALGRVCILDEQGCEELARARDEFVVGLN